MPKFIQEDGILLPDFLFSFDNPKSKSVSPTATFNPASALSGEGFKTSSAPSNKATKKTLIFDKSSIKYLDYGEQIALVKRLQLAGFSIFLCCVSEEGTNVFHKIGDELENISLLRKLSDFNEKTNYNDLANLGVARDNALVLNQKNQEKVNAVKKAFSSNNYSGPFSGNDWRCEFRSFLDEEFKLTKDNISFYFSRTTPSVSRKARDSFLRKYSKENDPEEINRLYFSASTDLKENFFIDQNLKRGNWRFDFNLNIDDILFKIRDSPQIKDEIISSNFMQGLVKELRKTSTEQQKSCIDYFHAKLLTSSVEKINLLIKEFPNERKKFLNLLKIQARNHHDLIENIPEPILGKTTLLKVPEFQRMLVDIHSGKIESFFKDGKIAKGKEWILEYDDLIIPIAKTLSLANYLSQDLLELLWNELYKKTNNSPAQLDSKKLEEISLKKLIEFTESLPGERKRCADLFLKKFPDKILLILPLVIQDHPQEAEELLANHGGITALVKGARDHPFFSEKKYEILLFIKKLPLEIRNRIYDANPTEADYHITTNELTELNYPKKSNPKPKQTYLDVVGLKDKEKLKILLNKFSENDLSEVAVMNFRNSDVDEIVSFLEELFPTKEIIDNALCNFTLETHRLFQNRVNNSSKIRHLVFSKDLEKNQKLINFLKGIKNNTYREDQEISYYFVDHQNYLGINEELKSIQERRANPNKQNSPLENQIRVARNAFSKDEVADVDSHSTYHMLSAGEVLNDASFQPQIRTRIIKRDILNTLEQEEFEPSNFTKIENRKLTSPENFRNSPASQGIYLQFTQQLRKGTRLRLLSADAHEEFMGYLEETSEVMIERGDDDFFYATALTQDCVLSYVTKVSQDNNYDTIPENNPIRKIIDQFKSTPKNEDLLRRYESSEHDNWLEEIFKNNSGSCRHKVAAVEYQLRKSKDVNQKDVRVVGIDNNHVILEIRHDGKWIKVDVGGGGNYTEVNAGKDEVYESREVSTKTRKTTLKESEESELAKSPPRSYLEPTQTSQKIPAPNNDLSAKEFSLEDLYKKLREEAERTALEQARNAAQKATSEKLNEVFNFTQISEVEDLKSRTIKPRTIESENSKILVVSQNLEDHANFFLSEATNLGRKTFYIDSASKIDINQPSILIDEAAAKNEDPVLCQEGLLLNFLQNAEIHPKNYAARPLLLINWQSLNSKQRLALNTTLDQVRTINGKNIDDLIQIIGLSSDKSNDPSFLSRNNSRIESNLSLPNKTQEDLDYENIQLIDLQGFPDWKRQLFGKVVLIGEKMVWQRSQFVEDLEAGEIKNFEIANLSQEATQELQYQFNQAKAAGHFTYHGYRIPLSPDLEITCANDSFDFGKFSESEAISVTKNVTYNQAPQDCTLINTYLFDLLICDKEITADGEYLEKDGLIKRAEKSSEVLKLFISSNLSDNQWYCLFDQAKNIKLELHLAPQVEMPFQTLDKEIEEEVESKQTKEPNPKSKIFVTNNTDQVVFELETQFAVIDVEDFTYQDLVEKITFTTDENGFRNFVKTESEFLSELKAGKKIALKGKFSSDLLQMLEPLLTSQDPEFTNAGANLTLIIEDKNCQENQAYEPLSWLSQDDYEIRIREKSSNSIAPITEKWKSSTDLQNITDAKEASDFIEQRKRLVLSTLQDHSMLQLVGYSGVGKSGLMKELATESIVCEDDDFEKWAQNSDTNGKLKILFIDESNIEDFHFTKFSPLKNGGNRKVLHDGKFHDLSPNHRIVFACNPADFGGGRNTQKLFENDEIPAIELRDFPRSYIYDKILRESIYEEFSNISSRVTEADFKKRCNRHIDEYQEINSRKKSDKDANEETVRELQEKVLTEFAAEIRETSELEKIKTKNFISTNATKKVEEALSLSLDIRHQQRNHTSSSVAVGLNGILLEGDSGVGKSVLISAMLDHKKITKKDLKDADQEGWQYYKIDANLPLEDKKKIITKAFEEGNIVWIDEINSCIDDGLEKILNSALTGKHPEGKQDAKPQAGFMLISSVNSAGLEGRSIISPALLHRTTRPKVQSLKKYSEKDLTEIVQNWLEDKKYGIEENILSNISQNIAANFIDLLHGKGGETLNLRMLKENLEEILPNYKKLAEIEQNDLSKKPSTTIVRNLAKKDVFNVKDFIAAMTPIEFEEVTAGPAIGNLKKIGTRSGAKNLDQLKLLHPKFSNETKLSETNKFDFSTTQNNSNLQSLISESLELARIESQISEKQASAIILSAIKNGGTQNKKLLEEDLKKANSGESHLITAIKARKFSQLFQEKMLAAQIFTGNEAATGLVGMRLKRLTPDYALEILRGDLDKFSDLYEKINVGQKTAKNNNVTRLTSFPDDPYTRDCAA